MFAKKSEIEKQMGCQKYNLHLTLYESLLEISTIDTAEKTFSICEMLLKLSIDKVRGPQDDQFYDEVNLKAAKSFLGTFSASTILLKERKLEFLKKLKSAFK